MCSWTPRNSLSLSTLSRNAQLPVLIRQCCLMWVIHIEFTFHFTNLSHTTQFSIHSMDWISDTIVTKFQLWTPEVAVSVELAEELPDATGSGNQGYWLENFRSVLLSQLLYNAITAASFKIDIASYPTKLVARIVLQKLTKSEKEKSKLVTNKLQLITFVFVTINRGRVKTAFDVFWVRLKYK